METCMRTRIRMRKPTSDDFGSWLGDEEVGG